LSKQKEAAHTGRLQLAPCFKRYASSFLCRRSRCFPRSLDTLRAVLEVFADAYNAFGVAKMKFRQNRNPKSRELPFSVLDFL